MAQTLIPRTSKRNHSIKISTVHGETFYGFSLPVHSLFGFDDEGAFVFTRPRRYYTMWRHEMQAHNSEKTKAGLLNIQVFRRTDSFEWELTELTKNTPLYAFLIRYFNRIHALYKTQPLFAESLLTTEPFRAPQSPYKGLYFINNIAKEKPWREHGILNKFTQYGTPVSKFEQNNNLR